MVAILRARRVRPRPCWGKTTLLSEWYASPEEDRPFAWVSLDPSDDDPVRFWSYVLGAPRIVQPAALPDVGPDLVDAVLPPLLNDLAGLQQRLVLVLDDYHFVHNASSCPRRVVAFLGISARTQSGHIRNDTRDVSRRIPASQTARLAGEGVSRVTARARACSLP